MLKIEQGLHQHYASQQASNLSLSREDHHYTSLSTGSAATDQSLIETPFAKVNTVVSGSPADEAGLKAGDKIRRFGDVSWMNHENLGKIAEVVQRSQGVRPPRKLWTSTNCLDRPEDYCSEDRSKKRYRSDP